MLCARGTARSTTVVSGTRCRRALRLDNNRKLRHPDRSDGELYRARRAPAGPETRCYGRDSLVKMYAQIMRDANSEAADVEMWSRVYSFDRCFDSMSTTGDGCATQVRGNIEHASEQANVDIKLTYIRTNDIRTSFLTIWAASLWITSLKASTAACSHMDRQEGESHARIRISGQCEHSVGNRIDSKELTSGPL